MKIALLGATGQTGQFLVKQALEQGHTVTAVVRNPAKLTVHHDNLKVKLNPGSKFRCIYGATYSACCFFKNRSRAIIVNCNTIYSFVMDARF